MANLTNRNIVIRDDEGHEIVAKCIGQSPAGHWIKVLADGIEQMVHSDAFVRVDYSSYNAPFCHHPEKCGPVGRCLREIACND